MHRFAFIGLLLGATVAALPVAQMRLPDDFAATAERIAISGFGGRNKGHYSLAGYDGQFTRDETRLGVFDPLLVRNKGESTFSINGSNLPAEVTAKCAFRKKAVTVGIVTFDPQKLTYECDIDTGSAPDMARFLLGQPAARGFKAKFLAQERRVGEISVFGQVLQVESEHDYKGSPLTSAVPVGYRLLAGDDLLAAVELTDSNPVIYLRAGADQQLRNAVIVTALAIAVFRDPAHSALETS